MTSFVIVANKGGKSLSEVTRVNMVENEVKGYSPSLILMSFTDRQWILEMDLYDSAIIGIIRYVY